MNSNIKIAYIVLCHKNAGQINTDFSVPKHFIEVGFKKL